MPRSKPQSSNTSNNVRTYIEYKVTDDDRLAIREWCSDMSDLWEMVQQLLDSQYVFKCAYEKSNDCYACYISGHWLLNKPDANTTLTGRGSSWDRALRQAMWVHFIGIGTDWSGWKDKKAEQKSWD